ncbi:MAG TPA: Asp-tRNA(Asn)/Glu-tRNA(Gln) amidotransferase subunit GatB [Planctomycetota bacterium]|nr:Asp-tRNA(Asn)/Glu-tRNA(Gln) amidotransferase subunit GatB [Planctomycetota bacterium]
MAEYEAVIGLEVHVQLNTKSKLFCGCSTAFGAEANTQTCPVCLGLPGVLPVLNRAAFEKSVQAALALGCEIAPRTKFDRKNYYYPDLPKNYQISQYDMPLSTNGRLSFEVGGREKSVRIRRAHLEEDAGKLLHDDPRGSGKSLVDLNRTGTPLLEIVTEPDLSSAEEAVAYLAALKQLLEYIDVSDCEMQEGSMRCEPNVSVRPKGRKELGVKTEIKNLNSFKNVAAAVEYEIKRHIKLLESGERVRQETMLWDAEREVTAPMRSKEEAHDYRYFPEPDLPPFTMTPEAAERLRRALPELPAARRARFGKALGLDAYSAGVLTAEKPVADWYEGVLSAGASAPEAAKWVINDCLREREDRKLDFADFPVKPAELAALIGLVDKKTINATIARQKLLPAMFETRKGAAELVKELGLVQVTDTGAISAAIDAAIQKNPKALADYRGGRPEAIMFLVGQVMRETRGKANAQAVRELLEKRLKELG